MPPGKEPSRLRPQAGADDEYAIRDPLPAAPIAAQPDLRRYEPIATWEPPPPPPKFPFVVGVVNFPFYLKTMPVWLFLSMSWIAGFLSLMGALWLAENGDPMIVARFIMPVVCLIFFATGAFTAACMVATLEHTASGYDVVDEWPRGEFREWLVMFGTLFMPLVAAMLAATAVKWITPGGLWLPGLVLAFLTYPIFALSAFDNGSMMAVISGQILRSLGVVWWAWGLLYVVSGVLLVPVLAIPALLFTEEPWLTALLTGPLLAAWLLIYARLLGRVAWCYSERVGDGKEDDAD